jgi:2-polyprenyl-3-methyl-5-hydroxy-6-metoxy-1,4-benzoquinol methylase
MRLPYFSRPLATVAPRDLLLFELLELSPAESVLEIGIGTGSSIIRLASRARDVHGADVAGGAVERLKSALERTNRPRNVAVFVQDFCVDQLPAALQQRYDVVFSCDTLEHVQEPGRFFKNVHRALKPGGRAFITFPNESPERAHGITFFERREKLQQLLMEAGFQKTDTTLCSVRMAPMPAAALKLAWRMPRRVGKAVLNAVSPRSSPAPQVFDDTDLYRWASHLDPVAPVINLYSWLVMSAMARLGPVYRVLPLRESAWDCQVLIRTCRTL